MISSASLQVLTDLAREQIGDRPLTQDEREAFREVERAQKTQRDNSINRFYGMHSWAS